MSGHEIEEALRSIGVEPDDLQPGVLSALRDAGTTPSDTMAAAAQRALEQTDAQRVAARKDAADAFSRDVAAGWPGALTAPPDLEASDPTPGDSK